MIRHRALAGLALTASLAALSAPALAQAPQPPGAPEASPAPSAASGTLNAQYAALQLTQAAQPAVPAVVTPAPAPAAAEPQVALARRVVESATAFAAYMQRASAVRADYADGAGVSRALDAGGTYEGQELAEGVVAYAALTALQDPMFVQAVQDLAPDAATRVTAAARLAAQPSLVLQLPGAASAGMRSAAALGHLGLALDQAGAAVKHSAYDIQHDAWSRANVVGPDAVLARLKAASAGRAPLTDDGGRALMTSLVALRAVAADGEAARATPVIARGLTLAALAILGQAGEERADQLLPILAEGENAQCMKMARLNLYQCLSVAGPQYEDVFCLGQHAMMETAHCVETASGWTPVAAAPPPVVQVAAAPRPASFYVPVALSEPAGAAPAMTATPISLAMQGGAGSR